MSSATEALMVVGTGSGVGKSSLVTGLGRLLRHKGIDVAPFKAQNMSNNSNIAVDGGEIATSQYVQARACELAPSTDFNPILLKPNGDGESEVVLSGEPDDVMSWSEYRGRYESMRDHVLDTYRALRNQHEMILLEGAGSPAEPNLMDRDLVNLSLAQTIDCPVVLVGDISKGGVFAWLLGTMRMLEPEQRDLVEGVVINKFRGDRSVLDGAIRELENRLDCPVLGVLPHVDDLNFPSEDSQGITSLISDAEQQSSVSVAMVRFPKISNFTDFETLANRPDVDFSVVDTGGFNGQPDLVILPGTKNTLEDLRWLKRTELVNELRNLKEQGVPMLGVCGGFQMMGKHIRDPSDIESGIAGENGLGWFDFEVNYREPKLTRNVTVQFVDDDHQANGYEIRYGRLNGTQADSWIKSTDEVLGWQKNQCYGTTLHGIFSDAKSSELVLRSVHRNGYDNGDDPFTSKPSPDFDSWAELLDDRLDLARVSEKFDSTSVQERNDLS